MLNVIQRYHKSIVCLCSGVDNNMMYLNSFISSFILFHYYNYNTSQDVFIFLYICMFFNVNSIIFNFKAKAL